MQSFHVDVWVIGPLAGLAAGHPGACTPHSLRQEWLINCCAFLLSAEETSASFTARCSWGQSWPAVAHCPWGATVPHPRLVLLSNGIKMSRRHPTGAEASTTTERRFLHDSCLWTTLSSIALSWAASHMALLSLLCASLRQGLGSPRGPGEGGHSLCSTACSGRDLGRDVQPL